MVEEGAPGQVRRLERIVDPRPAAAIAATTGKIPGAPLIPIEDVEAGNLPPACADRSIRVVTTCQAGPVASRTVLPTRPRRLAQRPRHRASVTSAPPGMSPVDPGRRPENFDRHPRL